MVQGDIITCCICRKGIIEGLSNFRDGMGLKKRFTRHSVCSGHLYNSLWNMPAGSTRKVSRIFHNITIYANIFTNNVYIRFFSVSNVIF